MLAIAMLISLNAYAGDEVGVDIRWNLDSDWGEPEFSQYTAINPIQQWRYERAHATLIITKTQCQTCAQVSQALVNDYDQQSDTTAILVNIKGVPGMLSLYESPKGVNFRTYVVVKGEYQYEFQLGINESVVDEISFGLERGLLSLINEVI